MIDRMKWNLLMGNVCCGTTGTFLTCLINIFQLNSLPVWDGWSFFCFLSLFEAHGEHFYSFTGVCLPLCTTLVDLCLSSFAAIWQLSLILKSHWTINIYFWTICQGQGVCPKIKADVFKRIPTGLEAGGRSLRIRQPQRVNKEKWHQN